MLPAELLLNDVCCGDPTRVAVALQAAHGRGDELVPGIVARLEAVLADPAAWIEKQAPNPGFLLFLAAEFRAVAAHAPIVGILRLDEKTSDNLLGDVITGGAAAVLADTYPGDPAPLIGLIEDAGAGPFARGTGLRALAKLWKRGKLPREDLLAEMVKLAAALDPASECDGMTANQLVETAVRVQAVEIRETILALYERGLADEGYFESGYAAAHLQPGAPAAPEAEDWDDAIDDAWEALRDWAFFDPEPANEWIPDPVAPVPAPPPPAPPPTEYAPPVPYRAPPKVGRNEPCPCGSGKKFKKCCGA